MPVPELSEEEVFNDDKDPLDALRELRAKEDQEDQEDQKKFEDKEEEKLEEEKSEESKESEKTSDEEQKKDEDEKKVFDDSEDDSEKEQEHKDLEKLKFKANGQEFEFTKDEVIEQFETVFGQAMNYTQKMQQIAPYRKMISALESEGITAEALNVAIDALKGDKGAIKTLIEANELDPLDLSDDEETQSYIPNEYGKSEIELQLEDIVNTISADKEYPITAAVVNEQWDNKSREIVASNPEMIMGLHNDIKSGLYDKVAPLAMKMKVLDGNTKSDLEYYILAGQQITLQEQPQNNGQAFSGNVNMQTQESNKQSDSASSEAAERRRAAGSTSSRAGRKGVVDYLDDDDEKFNAWYENLMRNN